MIDTVAGMPGVQPHIRQTLQFLTGNLDRRQEIDLAIALVGDGVRRDARHPSIERWGGALLEGNEPDRRRHIGMNDIDIERLDACFDYELVLVGHEVEDRPRGPNNQNNTYTGDEGDVGGSGGDGLDQYAITDATDYDGIKIISDGLTANSIMGGAGGDGGTGGDGGDVAVSSSTGNTNANILTGGDGGDGGTGGHAIINGSLVR